MTSKKTRAAIAYFEDAIRESDEIMAECTPDLQAELTEQKGHFVVALEAMRRATEPDNNPLTLEELRGMDGEPVWIENHANSEDNGYYLVNLKYEQYFGRPDFVSEVLMSKNGGFFMMNNIGKGMTAYRRPPEKGDIHEV